MEKVDSLQNDIKAKLKPVVNFNSCGGKEDCEVACPYEVFDVRKIDDADRHKLNLKGRIKTFFNSNKAYVALPDLCKACGFCVTACPEKAIRLVRDDQ